VHDRDLRLVLARDLALLPTGRLDLRKEQVLVRVASEDLADADQEEELEGNAIAKLRLSGNDAVDDVAVDSGRSMSRSRGLPIGNDGVPWSLNSPLCPAEEGHEHGAYFFAFVERHRPNARR
jgi:hypothetical protein